MSHIRIVDIQHLEVGMYVSEETGGLQSSGMQAKGFISRPESISKLKKAGHTELIIDIKKGKNSPFARPLASETAPLKPRKSLDEERENAIQVYDEALSAIGDMLLDVKMGKGVDSTPITTLADDINHSLLSNHNALLNLSRIREKDRYLLEHSINVAILMGIFSRFLGYGALEVKELVFGALLHDIGKIRVPDDILHKPGRLDEEEWEEMKRHVDYGIEALDKTEGISDIVRAICAEHHERLDGSGYPVGLNESRISRSGRMMAIVDIYDAVTATRVYHNGMPPFEAMRLLLDLSDKHLDKNLVHAFIKCMGVYPVGSLVELNNKRLGVVIATGIEVANKPTVKIFYNLNHNHHERPKDIDLSKPAFGELKIIRCLDPEELKIDLSQYLN